MTVQELIDKLKQFPGDKLIRIDDSEWGHCGIIDVYEIEEDIGPNPPKIVVISAE